jgi:hypothetical protein
MTLPQESNALDELEDRMNNPPKPWDPEERLDDEDAIREPSVVGVIEEIEERDSGYGPFKLTVIRRRDNSRVRVAWFGTVLESRSKNLAVGDAVGLTFLGRKESQDESLGAYANFEVVHRKPATGPRPVEPDLDDEDAPPEEVGA